MARATLAPRRCRLSRLLLPIVIVALAAGTAAAADTPRHLIYLHGRIIQEQQSARPRHAEYGFYELEKIVEAFRSRGFIVTTEVRPEAITVSDAADRVVEQVRRRIAAGVPPDRITVAGASMGASIALRVAARLGEPRVRFVFLGPCLSTALPAVAAEEGVPLTGRLLGVREESDIPGSECASFRNRRDARELVINTGLRHGFLYQPLPEWVEPAVEWARR